jgi:hypothetical protein
MFTTSEDHTHIGFHLFSIVLGEPMVNLKLSFLKTIPDEIRPLFFFDIFSAYEVVGR